MQKLSQKNKVGLILKSRFEPVDVQEHLKHERLRMRFENILASKMHRIINQIATETAKIGLEQGIERMDNVPIKFQKSIKDQMVTVHRSIFHTVGKEVFDTYSGNKSGNTGIVTGNITGVKEFNPWGVEIAMWVEELTETRSWLVAESFKKDIEKWVANGIAEGHGADKISIEIRKKIKGVSKHRAMKIARTETVPAYNKASKHGARESGMRYKVWSSVLDERTRPSHADMHGTKVPIDTMFGIDGELMDIPGDPSASASGIINCRCTMTYTNRD